ncbi:MAG: hypothetical protein ACYDBQ_00015 [Thermoplasmatota archaeon]
MESERGLLTGSLAGLAVACLLATAGLWWGGGLTEAHALVVLFGFLIPFGVWLQLHMVRRIAGLTLPAGAVRRTLILGGAGTVVVAASALTSGALVAWGYRAGMGLLLVAAGMHTGAMLRMLPKKSIVDVARDPLTKGDDACMKLLRFSHFFLALSLLGLLVAGPWWQQGWHPAFSEALFLASLHLLLVGYGLLSLYGVSHLVVPRLSGVPAIAAGAIKGELHTTLLGIVGLVAGLLWEPWNPGVGRALMVGLGFFVFVGAFTFMGVLGANIMKNKSATQRVTREFAYVPWTFAGVFWLLSGVLAGLLLPAAKAKIPTYEANLTFLHAHTLLMGGFTLIALGFLTRLWPSMRGREAPLFSRMRWPFYGLNAGLALLLWGDFEGGVAGLPMRAGALVTLVALAGWFFILEPPNWIRGFR